MLFLGPDIPMNLEEFHLFRDFVYQHCGLHFTEDSKYLLEKRLGKRLQHHNLKNFKDYYYLLRYSPAKEQELTEVVDLLTTNETYFFREDFQLRTCAEEILPELRERKEKNGNRQLRIWSAGCSSGEEPYTIAMLLLDQPWLRNWRPARGATASRRSGLRTLPIVSAFSQRDRMAGRGSGMKCAAWSRSVT